MQDLYAGHTKEPAEDAGMLHHSDHSPQRRAWRGVQQQGRVFGNEAAKPHLEIGQILRRQSRPIVVYVVQILHNIVQILSAYRHVPQPLELEHVDRAQVAPVLVGQEAEEGAIVNHAQDVANVPCKPGARIFIFTTRIPKKWP